MKPLFNRWLPALTFAAWGVVTLFFGSNSRYLAEPFTLYAQIAGVILLLCAVVLAVTRPDVACCAEAACGHGLSRSVWGKISTFAVIALPLALMPLGSESALAEIQKKNRKLKETVSANEVADYKRLRASQRPQNELIGAKAVATEATLPGSVAAPPLLPLPAKEETPPAAPEAANGVAGSQSPAPAPHPAAADPQDFSQYFDKSPEGNIIVEVLDLLYAAQDQVLMKDFADKRVELVVQYMESPKSKPGEPIRFKGVRMFMQCCTADARPIATLVEVAKLPDLPEMTWVKVVGTATFQVERGMRVAVLKADRVEKTEPPAETMLQ